MKDGLSQDAKVLAEGLSLVGAPQGELCLQAVWRDADEHLVESQPVLNVHAGTGKRWR